MQNHCSHKRKFLLGILFSFMLLLLLPATIAHAKYNSTSLSPASGVITTTGTNINVVVDSGNDNLTSIHVKIDYPDTLEFIEGSTVAASKCGSLTATSSAGSGGVSTLNVYCFNTSPNQQKYSGPVATLKFKAKVTTGTATLKFSYADDKHGTNLVGGTYTLGDGSGTGGKGGSDLPKSGIFDHVSKKIVVGASLILMGVFLSVIPKLIALVKHNFLNDSVSNTVNALLTKQQEGSAKRRRGKLEKRF